MSALFLAIIAAIAALAAYNFCCGAIIVSSLSTPNAKPTPIPHAIPFKNTGELRRLLHSSPYFRHEFENLSPAQIQQISRRAKNLSHVYALQ